VNARHVGIVFRKELLETLRDRRTLVTSILVPILLFPVMIFGIGLMTILVIRGIERETHMVMLLGEEHAPELAGRIRAGENVFVVAPAADYAARIDAKELRAAVEFPAGFEERLRADPEEPQEIILYWYEGELRSRSAVRTMEKILAEYRKELVAARIAERGLDEDVARPFAVEKANVAPPEKVTGTILGLLLPYFIIILCLTGAMYPAMDLTAGEKERGTMETILVSPVGRGELVAGKFLLVLLTSVATTALSIASFALTVLMGANLAGRFGVDIVLAVSGKAVAAVFLMVLPLAVLFSAALLALALYARSYREAQTYLGPLFMVVILPAIFSMLPGIELNARLAMVPILNVSLVAREIFSGVYQWDLIALIFVSTSVLAAAALWFAARQFRREEVLFRS
jgi:sodium transport system permease protein